jgi:hypothetical protein
MLLTFGKKPFQEQMKTKLTLLKSLLACGRNELVSVFLFFSFFQFFLQFFRSIVFKTGTLGSEPKENDAMRMNAWLTIARESIINRLTSKCGLQLKLSANSTNIFCRIRAPIKLLEVQADRDNYVLQLKGEIDPGSEHFWNVEVNNVAVEIEEEKQIYTLEEAKLILERLYRAGKISPNELVINPDLENQASFTRRVHALERIADRVPITNKFVPYAAFMCSKPHLR